MPNLTIDLEENMFDLRPPAPPVELQFDIDIYKEDGKIFMEIEWGQDRISPERLVLRLSPSETRELVNLLEKQLRPQLSAA